MSKSSVTVQVTLDWDGLVRCVHREGAPRCVHYTELFLDAEVQAAIFRRYDLLADLSTMSA